MAKESVLQGKTYYLCSKCGMAYTDREWAQRCEDFCTKYNACSIEITQHGVYLPETQ